MSTLRDPCFPQEPARRRLSKPLHRPGERSTARHVRGGFPHVWRLVWRLLFFLQTSGFQDLGPVRFAALRGCAKGGMLANFPPP